MYDTSLNVFPFGYLCGDFAQLYHEVQPRKCSLRGKPDTEVATCSMQFSKQYALDAGSDFAAVVIARNVHQAVVIPAAGGQTAKQFDTLTFLKVGDASGYLKNFTGVGLKQQIAWQAFHRIEQRFTVVRERCAAGGFEYALRFVF